MTIKNTIDNAYFGKPFLGKESKNAVIKIVGSTVKNGVVTNTNRTNVTYEVNSEGYITKSKSTSTQVDNGNSYSDTFIIAYFYQ